MKLINIFLLCLGVMTIISCKTNSSDVSDSLIRVKGSYSYGSILLGTAYDDENEEVICMFECDGSLQNVADANQHKKEYCGSGNSTPRYMKYKKFEEALFSSDLDSCKNVPTFGIIDKNITSNSDKLLVKDISELQFKCILSIFERNTGNSGIAKGICNPILDSQKSNAMSLLVWNQKTDPKDAEGYMNEAEIEKRKQQIGSDPKDYLIKTGNIYYDRFTQKTWYLDLSKTAITSFKAREKCKTLANKYNNWRLPSIMELYTLYMDGVSKHVGLGTKAWSNTFEDSIYNQESHSWIISLNSGTTTSVFSEGKDPYNVLCVMTNPNNIIKE